MKKIVVLASGAGSTFKYLYDNLKQDVDFVFVGYDREASVVSLANNCGVKTINVKNNMLKTLKKHSPDLIVLAGYLSIIPKDVVAYYSGKIINVHPSILPKYGGKGFYGKKVHNAVKENNDLISGASVHYVNEEYDKGRIIAQRFVNVENLSALEIEEKVKYVEKRLLVYVVKELLTIEAR